MASFSSAVFALLLFLHVSSLAHGRPLDGRGHFMIHKKSMEYNPVAGGDDTLADSKMFMLHKKSLHYNPVAGGDDTLAASKMSLGGFMHPEKSLFYNPIVGSPSGDDMLAARWSESPPPPSTSVVLELEPPPKPRSTCWPRC